MLCSHGFDEVKVFLSNSIRKENQKLFAFKLKEQKYAFTVLPKAYVSSSALCCNAV